MALHRKQKLEEDKRIEKIGEYMLKKTKEMMKEDEAKREAKRQAGLKYQRELDEQLKQSQQRSLNSLIKTMNDREIAMNSDLIKKVSKMGLAI